MSYLASSFYRRSTSNHFMIFLAAIQVAVMPSVGFSVSDCNKAPMSPKGSLWINACSNGTFSASWNLSNYGESRIAPIVAQYTCISTINETSLSTKSYSVNLGNLKASSKVLLSNAGDNTVCTVSICHVYDDMFTFYTLGPTVCSLGTPSPIITPSFSSYEGQWTTYDASETSAPELWFGSLQTLLYRTETPSAKWAIEVGSTEVERSSIALQYTPTTFDSEDWQSTAAISEVQMIVPITKYQGTYKAISVGLSVSILMIILAVILTAGLKLAVSTHGRRRKMHNENAMKQVMLGGSDQDIEMAVKLRSLSSSTSVATILDSLERDVPFRSSFETIRSENSTRGDELSIRSSCSINHLETCEISNIGSETISATSNKLSDYQDYKID